MIDATYRCGGCDAVETVEGIHLEFVQVAALAARAQVPTFRTAAPDGWMTFDPYTGVTYCPTCWADIETPSRGRSGATDG